MVSKSRTRRDRNAMAADPLYKRLPPQYYGYALQWWSYPRWTVEEAANLLASCVPTRELLLPGDEHRMLDDEIVGLENQIRAALDHGLTRVTARKYFEQVFVASAEILDWARSAGIDIPEQLLRAHREVRRDHASHGYRTPCMAAMDWVVERYWEGADLRDAPTRGEIVTALLQAFPDLSPQECEMIEYISRHPAAMVSDP